MTNIELDDIQKAHLELFGDFIEKAVYADTPQNRKLGRVGQEWHRGKGKKEDNEFSSTKKTKKLGKSFSAKVTNSSKSKTNKKVDVWTIDKKISHVKSLMEKLSAEDRKALSPFVKKASTGQLSVDDLYRHYMKVRYKGVRSRASAQRPPWDSRNSHDLRHSD